MKKKFRVIAALVVAGTLAGGPSASAFDDSFSEDPFSGFISPREMEWKKTPPFPAPDGYVWVLTYEMDSSCESRGTFTTADGGTEATQICTVERVWKLQKKRR